MGPHNDGDEGLLVNGVGAIFGFLKKLTPVELLFRPAFRHLNSRDRANIVDVWIVSNLAAAFLAAAFAMAHEGDLGAVQAVIAAYAAYRLFDIVVVQVNVLLFDPYYHRRRLLAGLEMQPYALRGRYRLALALLANFLEIALWCSAVYFSLQDAGFVRVEGTPGEDGVWTFLVMLQQNVKALVTFDISAFKVTSGSFAYALVILQSFVGMFLTIVMLARVISLLPSPKAETDHNDVRA